MINHGKSQDVFIKELQSIIALFLGTGNQTAHMSSAIVERLFDVPNMKLWSYDPETLLPAGGARASFLLHMRSHSFPFGGLTSGGFTLTRFIHFYEYVSVPVELRQRNRSLRPRTIRSKNTLRKTGHETQRLLYCRVPSRSTTLLAMQALSSVAQSTTSSRRT